jgi:chromosome segregation ATPase
MVGGSNEPEQTSDVWRVQAELLKDERDRLRGDLDQANRERSQLTAMLGGLQEKIGQTVARLEAQAANIATLEPMADLGKAITSYPGWRGRLVRWIIHPKR